jgi:hypothetical protein
LRWFIHLPPEPARPVAPYRCRKGPESALRTILATPFAWLTWTTHSIRQRSQRPGLARELPSPPRLDRSKGGPLTCDNEFGDGDARCWPARVRAAARLVRLSRNQTRPTPLPRSAEAYRRGLLARAAFRQITVFDLSSRNGRPAGGNGRSASGNGRSAGGNGGGGGDDVRQAAAAPAFRTLGGAVAAAEHCVEQAGHDRT